MYIITCYYVCQVYLTCPNCACVVHLVLQNSVFINVFICRRLFKEPNRREVYVCYEEGVPQNMIEIAFKLGINAIG